MPRCKSLRRRAGLSFGQLLAPNLMLLFMPVPHTSLFPWLTGLSRNQLIRYHRCVWKGLGTWEWDCRYSGTRQPAPIPADVCTAFEPLSFHRGSSVPAGSALPCPLAFLLQLDGPRHDVDPHRPCRAVLCVLGNQQDRRRVS